MAELAVCRKHSNLLSPAELVGELVRVCCCIYIFATVDLALPWVGAILGVGSILRPFAGPVQISYRALA